jgi:hypothetical protein
MNFEETPIAHHWTSDERGELFRIARRISTTGDRLWVAAKKCLHSEGIWFNDRQHFREEGSYVENL